MDFLLSPELRSIPDILRPFRQSELSSEKMREALTAGVAGLPNRELWKKFCELGLLGSLLPESLGGLGLGLLSSVVLLEEAQPPVNNLPMYQTLAHALLPLALMQGGTEGSGQLSALCERICSGATFASGLMLTAGIGLEVQHRDETSLVLSGQCFPLLGGPELEALVLVLEEDAGNTVYLLERNEEWQQTVTIEPAETLDLFRQYSYVQFEEASAKRIGSLDDLSQLSHCQKVLAAAELVGLCRAVIAMTVDYVKTREQFGRPVGSFQAVQHSLADMHLSCEQAASLTRYAGWSADECRKQDAGNSSRADFSQAALAASGFTFEQAPRVVEKAIQAHGGIGFTFEYDLHLYLRRAKTQAMVSESSSELYRELAEQTRLSSAEHSDESM